MRKCSVCKINESEGPTSSRCASCRREEHKKKVEEKRKLNGDSIGRKRPHWVLTREQIIQRDKEAKERQEFRDSVYGKSYYKKNAQELKDYQREYRKNNQESIRIKKKEYAQNLKKEGINAYGAKCSCCGEKIPEFLTIEHIFGRKDEKKRLTGIKMWMKLKSLGWPKEEYTLLCFNCNCAKGAYGKCPHQN